MASGTKAPRVLSVFAERIPCSDLSVAAGSRDLCGPLISCISVEQEQVARPRLLQVVQKVASAECLAVHEM